MAAPTCTRAALAETLPGLGLAGLNRRQYEAGLIYLKVLELAAIGGTDYRLTLTSTLIDDATALAKSMNPNQRKIAMLNIARNNAVAAGATAPETVTALNEATKCCFADFNNDLEAILILLECKLGVSKGYPQ
jgi:hypothetical protein